MSIATKLFKNDEIIKNCDFITKNLLEESKNIVLQPSRYKRMTFSDVSPSKSQKK